MFDPLKSALISLFISVFVHKLPRPGYLIYETSYKLNKATTRPELSFPCAMRRVNAKGNYE